MSIAFLVTALVIVVTPGTGVLYTLATGLSMGARAALVAAFACTLGIVPHLAAAITGLAALLHASAEAFEAIRIAGVAYLLWMAWVTWRDRTPLAIDSGTAAYSAPRIVSRGILINLLNPKLTIFFVAFLPQFIDPTAADQLTPMLTLSGVFMGLTLVVFAGYGVFAAGVRRHVIERPRFVTLDASGVRRVLRGAGRPAGSFAARLSRGLLTSERPAPHRSVDRSGRPTFDPGRGLRSWSDAHLVRTRRLAAARTWSDDASGGDRPGRAAGGERGCSGTGASWDDRQVPTARSTRI